MIDAEKSKNEDWQKEQLKVRGGEEEQVESEIQVETPVSFLSSLPVTMATCQQPVRASCSLFPFLSRWQTLTEPSRNTRTKIHHQLLP